MHLIDKIYSESMKLLINKEEKKNKGQFYTPSSIANFMSRLSSVEKTDIKILDPGSGTGVLSIALCLHISENTSVRRIQLDLYENDMAVYEILESNILKEYI